jgi:hypothetical protein
MRQILVPTIAVAFLGVVMPTRAEEGRALAAQKMRRFVLTFALTLAGSNAAAVLFDGNELLRKLQSTNPVDRAAAVGYVASISDTNEAFFVTNAVGPFHCFVVPAGVTADQLGDIARGWLEKHPAVRSENAISLVSRALGDSYPCK